MPDSESPKSFKWSDKSKFRRNEFASLLDAPEYKNIFDEKYFDGLERRKAFLEGRTHTVEVLHATVLLFLALAVLSVHLPISLFGVSSGDTRSFREVLLIIASTVQYMSMWYKSEQRYIDELLTTYVGKLSRGAESAQHALAVRYGLGAAFMIHELGHVKPTRFQKIATIWMLFSYSLWGLMAVAVVFLIQIAAVIDILRDPTISLTVSILVVVYVITVYFVTLGLQAMTGMIAPLSEK
jgi:hypothetical protein